MGKRYSNEKPFIFEITTVEFLNSIRDFDQHFNASSLYIVSVDRKQERRRYFGLNRVGNNSMKIQR